MKEKSTWLFIQLPPSANPPTQEINYRNGFFDWAQKWGNPQRDSVILYTLDESEVGFLETLWRGWKSLDIRISYPSLASETRSTRQIFMADRQEGRIAALDHFDAERWAPTSTLGEHSVPVDSLTSIIEAPHPKQTHICICADLRDPEQRHVISNAQNLSTICVVTAEAPQLAVSNVLQSLQKQGFRFSGRPFGEAKTSVVLTRSLEPKLALRACTDELRLHAGVFVERIQGITKSHPTSRLRKKSAAESRPSFLGEDIQYTHVPISRSEISSIVENVRGRPDGTWSVSVEEAYQPSDIAQTCYDELGLWPISFSFPSGLPLADPVEQLSPIIPGFPYSFADSDEYLSTYSRSSMAMTFRKAGWDCFRHVEILASGAIPLMPDADQIPQFAMIHYPKSSMAEVARKAVALGGIPDFRTRRAFRDYFNRHLTSRAMAEYMLEMSSLADAEKVLFIDEQMPSNPEYQSTLALIGLKQIFESRCEVAFPGDFIYLDNSSDTSSFYGRGFGYTCVLNPETRSTAERDGTLGHGLDALNSFDAVIVGSMSRNLALTQQVIESCYPRKVILIYGEDGPPHPTEALILRKSRASVFVRAIHS